MAVNDVPNLTAISESWINKVLGVSNSCTDVVLEKKQRIKTSTQTYIEILDSEFRRSHCPLVVDPELDIYTTNVLSNIRFEWNNMKLRELCVWTDERWLRSNWRASNNTHLKHKKKCFTSRKKKSLKDIISSQNESSFSCLLLFSKLLQTTPDMMLIFQKFQSENDVFMTQFHPSLDFCLIFSRSSFTSNRLSF